jgi:hypothetical protein
MTYSLYKEFFGYKKKEDLLKEIQNYDLEKLIP